MIRSIGTGEGPGRTPESFSFVVGVSCARFRCFSPRRRKEGEMMHAVGKTCNYVIGLTHRIATPPCKHIQDLSSPTLLPKETSSQSLSRILFNPNKNLENLISVPFSKTEEQPRLVYTANMSDQNQQQQQSKGFFGTAASGLGNTLGAASDTVGKGVGGATNTLGNTVSGLGKGLGDTVTGVTGGLGDTTKSAGDFVTGTTKAGGESLGIKKNEQQPSGSK
ncbi:unnamed protein product [Periconia digitata]|uniref:Uncharacterized protein n=1 Tax=Periconia digitata TaxID=1303443 RepID=A0A9W4UP27_9PLEO|nr:unnamed protein product [Periconia digitata]